ncbi:flp-27 [Pristionchus pacificus]|uniref:Uncharacterized protein n=1 Tax=Pristionchus pacificus TaxID=54126 RepID=A0A2A6B6Z3_PRIPA|nr:flp-27 [Pristionchus pacificus]|eukprot:PDM61631.1 hypothetical protein PRIPAC_51073 [Pristionchus pacificus]
MASLIQMVLLLSLLLITLCTVQAFDDYHPILMDRRDSSFNLDDLKSQALGGRMRFGKRSEGGKMLRLNEWRSQLFDRPI